MAKIISSAQKTFVDLYDSYILSLTPDAAMIPCTNSGAASAKTVFNFTYSVSVGNRKVGATCEISDNPDNISVNITQATSSLDGTITATIPKGANLAGKDDTTIKVTITTTDNSQVVLEKYITFVKVKTGANGANGKDGANIVTFKIYSEDGDTFKEGLDKITMETVAFDGLTQITNATYAWSYYNSNKAEWVNIHGGTTSSLVANKSTLYSSLVYRCIMTYNNSPYEDYFTLKAFNHNYDAVVKFFDGSNIFDASEPFIVAYLELYKDQQEEEMIKAPYYYYHTGNTYDVSTDKYTFNSTGVDDSYKQDGTMMYVVYKIVNSTENACAKYKARLCMYTNNAWYGVNSTIYGNKYVYQSDLYKTRYDTAEATNVFVISKEDVSKYKDINFTVYTKAVDKDGNYIYNNDLIVARNNITVIDLNDPVISSIEPADPKDGQLWLDTGSSPYTLYIYQNGEWVYFVQQNGKTVYTSKPSSYSEGDLWILASGEKCGNFGEGTMLRAKQNSSTFNASHWEDAMEEFTTLKTNIEQYFSFSATDGLKIGQTDDAFYVNISSKKMSFYDNSNKKNKEVVYISNESANIDGLVVEKNLDVNCNATFDGQVQFGKFVWKVESNGSLSLAIAT